VGFGDVAPVSLLGRAVGVVWMLLGTMITVNFIGAFSEYFIAVEKERLSFSKMTDDVFSEIDVDGNGNLTKFEFVSFVLLHNGILEKQDLDLILAQYDKLDVTGDGVVTYYDIHVFAEHM
jgi:hypothetical protein